MAIQFIKHNGNTYAVAFSIRELFALCSKRNVTLEELMQSSGGPLNAETYETALELACAALNAGARRNGSPADFTIDQLDEMFSDDLSLFEKIVNALICSMQKSEVFPSAGKKVKTKANR